MSIFRGRVFLAAALFVGIPLPGFAAPGFKVIANPSVPVQAMSRDSVSQIFTKKSAKWPDGSRVAPIDLPVGSKTREVFSQAVHGKGSAVVEAYWQKQLFSGRDLPPPTKANEAEIVSFVRATAGAIGYVAQETDANGVKVIAME
jgi:ABC-type phosphate transport system substrate-binding protein